MSLILLIFHFTYTSQGVNSNVECRDDDQEHSAHVNGEGRQGSGCEVQPPPVMTHPHHCEYQYWNEDHVYKFVAIKHKKRCNTWDYSGNERS